MVGLNQNCLQLILIYINCNISCINSYISCILPLIYPNKIRHVTSFMRVTLYCNDCKKANSENGKYSLTIKDNILEEHVKNSSGNQAAMVNVEYFTHVHLTQISSSQNSNSKVVSSSNDYLLSTKQPCSSNSQELRSNYDLNIELELPKKTGRLTKETYRDELRVF